MFTFWLNHNMLHAGLITQIQLNANTENIYIYIKTRTNKLAHLQAHEYAHIQIHDHKTN